jgi:diguanylate cyclase (GGDEF)-like protein
MGRDAGGMGDARPAKRGGMLALAGLSAALVAAWMTAFELARVLEYQPHASLWFPPVAVTVAALMVLGWRGVPAIAISSVLATLVGFERGVGTALDAAVAQYAVIFAVQQLGVWGGLAWVLRRASRHGPAATSLPRAVTFFILGGAFASLLSACIGSAGLLATGAIDVPTMIEQAIPWAIGDYAGLLALGPLAIAGVLRLADWLRVAPEPGVPRMSEMIAPAGSASAYAAKLSLLLGFTLAVMLAAAALPQQPAVVFALFVVVVVQLWIVHTHGTLHTLAAIAAFSLLIAIATPLLGLGTQALALQFAMISLAANSYFGLAVPGLYADNTRLRRALVRDPVTGALSRAGFLEQVRNDLRLAAPRNHAAALIIADMDNLKAINDELGHAAGDAALRAFVARCRRCLQPGQLIGRLGGDEFALYLPHTTSKTAQALVEKLRQALAHPREGDELPFPLSASFGIADCAPDDLDLDRLLERADAEMYADKRQRRASTPGRA